MLCLTPISFGSISELEDTSYAQMSDPDKRRMVRESMDKTHDGAFFEMLAVSDSGTIVGFMNLYARSERTISVGPEIKRRFRRQGYGFSGEMLALDYAREMGYAVAVADVREENAASIALHEKLGFEVGTRCLSKNGNPVRVYIKALTE